MKKLLGLLLSSLLLLSACTPQQVRLVRHCEASTVLVHVKLVRGNKRGYGTCGGVYVGPNLILTADHCVNTAFDGDGIKIKGVWIRNAFGDSAKATVIKQDPKRDLALLKTNLRGEVVSFAHNVIVGEDCYTVGMPLGISFVVSKGIVSKKDFRLTDFPTNHFVTDCVVLPGNSGGPCFDSHGHLIGILTMSTSLFGNFGAAGLGIVVQIDEVKTFLKVK